MLLLIVSSQTSDYVSKIMIFKKYLSVDVFIG